MEEEIEEIAINTNEERTEATITEHKDNALNKLNALFKNYIKNPELMSNADKLAYWIEDYCNLLKAEKTFKPCFLKKYERGDIIQVNLGYNIGNEEGGLHYCVVIDNNNPKSSGIITVIPLTSNKEKPLKFFEVDLHDDVYSSFELKYLSCRRKLLNEIANYDQEENSDEEIASYLENLRFLKKMYNKMQQMKKGSIALVSQITTISKQKIYDPQKTSDLLSGVKISDESLQQINNKLKKLYIQN